jgi:hypothetical protein
VLPAISCWKVSSVYSKAMPFGSVSARMRVIVDHDADRQHQAEQRQRVDREAEQMHDREGADDRYRHGEQRDDRGPPRLQEYDDDQHHESERLEQRVHHRLDRAAHEDGRVVDHGIVDAFREVLLQRRHDGADMVRDLDGVGTGRLEDRDGNRRLVVEQRAQAEFCCVDLDPGDVA